MYGTYNCDMSLHLAHCVKEEGGGEAWWVQRTPPRMLNCVVFWIPRESTTRYGDMYNNPTRYTVHGTQLTVHSTLAYNKCSYAHNKNMIRNEYL